MVESVTEESVRLNLCEKWPTMMTSSGAASFALSVSRRFRIACLLSLGKSVSPRNTWMEAISSSPNGVIEFSPMGGFERGHPHGESRA